MMMMVIIIIIIIIMKVAVGSGFRRNNYVVQTAFRDWSDRKWKETTGV